jgi:hypothetical protein
MVQNLYWRAKDVISFAAALTFVFASLTGYAQSTAELKNAITFSCSRATLDGVMDKLSHTTGLHFIYSSDRVKSNKQYSFSIANKSLNEVLAIVGREMNLEFKRKDRYVIVKAGQPTLAAKEMNPPSIPQGAIAYKPSLPVAFDSIIQKTVAAIKTQKTFFWNPSPSSALSSKKLFELQPYFDSSLLKSIPAQYVQKLNRNTRHAGWFIAGGALVNDYSAGVELQAGLRSVYLVYAPTWLRSGEFHGGYGLGGSVLLSRNFSFNPVYTYSTVNRKESVYTPVNTLPLFEHKLLVKHHQLKLMFKYSITENIGVLLGTTMNQSVTVHTFSAADAIYNSENKFYVKQATYAVGSWSQYPQPFTQPYESLQPRTPRSFEAIKSWIGWEASIQYRVNFFKHK